MSPVHRMLGAIVVVLSSLSATASADPLALVAVEGRMGAGIAMGGGQGGSTLKRAPFRAGALLERAILDMPWTSVTAGLIVETGDRMSVAGQVGLRVATETGVRVGAHLTGLIEPFSLYGGGASLGRCVRTLERTSLCLDVELSVFVAGSDLPDQRVAGQLQVVIGARFDVL